MKLKVKSVEAVHSYMNQPEGTEEVVRISDIKIPQEFSYTRPLGYKIKRCKERYKRLGYLDKPITVIAETNERGKPSKLFLVDGYSRYLYAKQIHLRYIPIRYQDINTYNIEL